MRIIRRLLTSLTLLIIVGFGAMYAIEPVVTTRLFGLLSGGHTGPEEIVAGNPASGPPVATPAARSIAAAALDAAVAYGAATQSHALIVYHDGAIQLEHYYPGHDASTRTSTYGMHKSVLALLVGIAIRDGFIASVDDPAARYLPEWANDERAKITLRDLLQQASGIDFPVIGLNPVGDFFVLALGEDIGTATLRRRAAEPPGTRFDDNVINPEVLALILQRATGKRYSAYLSQALWIPGGASAATVTLDSEPRALARAFCCLDATARSWLQIGLLHVNGGRWNGEQVVPAGWIRDIQTPSATNPGYGYLTWLGTRYEEHRRYNHKARNSAFQSEPFAAPDMVYFDGRGGQRVYAVPSLGLVIVRTGAITRDWDDAKLPNLIIRGIVKPAQ